MTKRRVVISTIAAAAKQAGITWEIAREGSRHTVYALGGTIIPIPRHNEINTLTAQGIYKECAAKLGKDWWKR